MQTSLPPGQPQPTPLPPGQQLQGVQLTDESLVYLNSTSEVNKLVMLVNEMRKKYYGVDGEKIFESAAQMMSTDN